MDYLSLTQAYLLCTLNEKGRYSSMDLEKGICLVAGSILELLMDGVLRLDEKRISTALPLPAEKEYLRTVYERVRRKEPEKLESVMEYFSFNFSDKNLYALLGTIGDSLAAAGCAEKGEGGLLRKTPVYLPDAKAKDRVIQQMRAELLEDGALSEDIVALTVLLQKCGELSRYFSAYEKKDLKARLKSIKNSSENQLVTKMVEYIENLFALVIIAAT